VTRGPEFDSVRSAWSAQPIEETVMSTDELRRSARRFQSRIGWRNAREYVAAAVVAGFFAYIAWAETLPLARAGAIMIVAGSLYVAWALHRRASARDVPDDAGARACVAFHRQELERQRDALKSVWRWYIGPVVPGFVLLTLGVLPRSGIASVLITLALGVLAFGGVVLLNRWGARKLQREIDQLPHA